MKKIFLILLCGFLTACNSGNGPAATIPSSGNSIPDFNWLLGNWQRTNEQGNRQTFEVWSRKGDSEYHGFGFTLQDRDTIWQEKIRLVYDDSSWNFEVTGNGENNATIFRLTNLEKESFIFENQGNPFPKSIAYARDGKKIIAVISGDRTEVPFIFEQIPEKAKADAP